jgi:hypothetical protein
MKTKLFFIYFPFFDYKNIPDEKKNIDTDYERPDTKKRVTESGLLFNVKQ